MGWQVGKPSHRKLWGKLLRVARCSTTNSNSRTKKQATTAAGNNRGGISRSLWEGSERKKETIRSEPRSTLSDPAKSDTKAETIFLVAFPVLTLILPMFRRSLYLKAGGVGFVESEQSRLGLLAQRPAPDSPHRWLGQGGGGIEG